MLISSLGGALGTEVKVESLPAPPSKGQFLWVNSSALGGPWVMSPWLWGGARACGLDMTVFLHPQQSGRYTVWLIERDKPPIALVSMDTPRRAG
ncbi:hypothetical protein AAFF_G00387780 [Aldrovandia affinis]|uniref:Uncharacterized protein n=1 Tax=Aldrovandia affinis TaxID=143900 RepID=A0AAD7SGV2_9TELE|nr:hypothetical protein AAFF_G00387780 [Aldrovandia affinis]